MLLMDHHLPECPFVEACNDEIPEHGYCSMQHGMFCINCYQWCICDALGACEQRVLTAAREAVEAIRDALQTHYRIDCEPIGKVDWSQHRGCDPVDDILAAIDALTEKP